MGINITVPEKGIMRNSAGRSTANCVSAVEHAHHVRWTPPCERCHLPKLKGELSCPRCAGAHWKALA